MKGQWNVGRLALAVLVAAGMSILFDVADYLRGLPTDMRPASLAFNFATAAAIYAVLLPCFYGAARGADRIGIAGWSVFPALFVALHAGLAIGGIRITALGSLGQNAAGIFAIALIDTIILFGWPSHWLRLQP